MEKQIKLNLITEVSYSSTLIMYGDIHRKRFFSRGLDTSIHGISFFRIKSGKILNKC